MSTGAEVWVLLCCLFFLRNNVFLQVEEDEDDIFNFDKELDSELDDTIAKLMGKDLAEASKEEPVAAAAQPGVLLSLKSHAYIVNIFFFFFHPVNSSTSCCGYGSNQGTGIATNWWKKFYFTFIIIWKGARSSPSRLQGLIYLLRLFSCVILTWLRVIEHWCHSSSHHRHCCQRGKIGLLSCKFQISSIDFSIKQAPTNNISAIMAGKEIQRSKYVNREFWIAYVWLFVSGPRKQRNWLQNSKRNMDSNLLGTNFEFKY